MAWCRSGNNLQAIIWTNGNLFYWCIYASLGPNELKGHFYTNAQKEIWHSFMVMFLLGSLNRENTVHRQLRFISCKAAIILGAAQWSDLIDSFSGTSNKIRVPHSNMQDESIVNVGRNINCNTQNIRINHMCMLNILIYIYSYSINECDTSVIPYKNINVGHTKQNIQSIKILNLVSKDGAPGTVCFTNNEFTKIICYLSTVSSLENWNLWSGSS